MTKSAIKMINRIPKRAALQLFRNLRTTMHGMLLVFLLITASALFAFYNNLSHRYLDSIERKYPAEILLMNKANDEETDTCIPESIFDEVITIPHIQGYNRTNIVHAQFIAQDYHGVWKESVSSSVSVITDLNTPLNSYFKSGQVELMMGHFPDAVRGGALVDADYFEISTEPFAPESIRLKFESDGTSFFADIPIVGVYKTIVPIESMINNVPVKQNIIFLHESSVSNISETLLDQKNMKFFLDDHSALEETMTELNGLQYDHERFVFLPSLSPDISMLLNSIRMSEASRNMIMMIFEAISTGMIILYLIIGYLNYRKHMNIYFMLGEKISCIIYEHCLKTFIVYSVTSLFSIITVIVFQPLISQKLLIKSTEPLSEGSFHSSFELQRHLLQHDFSYRISWKEIILSCLNILIVIVVFLIIYALFSHKKLRMHKKL